MPWLQEIDPPLTPAERQNAEDVVLGHEDRRPEPTLNQRIIGAVRETRAEPDWRPIASAPKDGTEIVVLSNRTRWIVSWYRDGWRIKALPGRDPIAFVMADKWSPLPASPAE